MMQDAESKKVPIVELTVVFSPWNHKQYYIPGVTVCMKDFQAEKIT